MKNWKDIYKLPLIPDDIISWVWDSNDNFVFQFVIEDESSIKNIIEILNGNNDNKIKDNTFSHKNGYILDKNENKIILIRGWGNLTGIGSHNLKEREAANIQDTFAEYIVNELNSACI